MSDYGFEKIKTIGDAFFAVSGIHTFSNQPIISAIELAVQMQRIASESPQNGSYIVVFIRGLLSSWNFWKTNTTI